ncbi:MAG TPA: c-type cytochrome, partial [Blastocatellia bacterium]|nr:c-type cytochrome [Blastocatellia bacterium]
ESMKNARLRFLVLLALLALLSTLQSSNGKPIAGVSAATEPTVASQTGAFSQEQAIAQLKAQISGKEQQPAEQVFKNIQLLKGVPAGRLLAIMEIGYSKSLGVNCTHCHVPGEWEKEEKPTKQITRDMSAMAKAINTEYLKTIKNLKSPNPVVNCTTCHRGQVKPALNLP